MKHLPRFLLLVVLCIIQQTAFSQDSLQFTVRGVVTDIETGAPIPQVNVTFLGTRFSTVTNSEGHFILKSSTRPTAVLFSHLGYRTASCPVQDLSKEIRISMSKGAIPLKEALLFGDPAFLLRTALEKIPENYSNVPERFQCFYRETVSKRSRYIFISEAVTDMFKSSYKNDIGIDRVMVEKSRVLVSPKTSDTLAVKVVGGPTQAVSLDYVKNRSGFFSEANISLYKLTLDTPETINDRPQYHIRMEPAAEVPFALQYASVYIDMETLAFTRIQMSLDVSDEEKATSDMLISKPVGLRFRPLEMSMLADYTYDGSVSRISYVRTVFRFTCDWKKRLLSTRFTATDEMVVTNRIEGTATPIRRNEAFSEYDALFDTAKEYADPDFWKNYNIIEPTTSLEHAVGRLRK